MTEDNVVVRGGQADSDLTPEERRLLEAERTRERRRKRCYQDEKVCIFVDGSAPLRDTVEAAVEAIKKHNEVNTYIFQRSGRLVVIRSVEGKDKDGNPTTKTIFTDVTPEVLTGILTNVANFVSGKGHHVDPPKTLVQTILARGAWPVPVVVGIVEVPTLRPDGTILDRPGYDTATGLVYVPDPNLYVPPIPEYPTEEDVQSALDVVNEMNGAFPYDSDASYANALAGTLTPLIRPAIKGRVPMELIDGTKIGTGKSLLANNQVYIATGRTAAVDTPPTEEAEWRKLILAMIKSGAPINVFDDVHSKITSGALQAAITQDEVGGRVLGLSEIVTVSNRCLWIATGNNLAVGEDMVRRCYRVGLDAGMAKPYTRTGFVDLDTWLPKNRGRVVAALLTIARAWFAAGQPEHSLPLPTLGNFQVWVDTVGSILEYAGVGDFLGNLEEFQEDADEEAIVWGGYLEALSAVFGDGTFTVKELDTLYRFEAEIRNPNIKPENYTVALDNKYYGPLGNVLQVVHDLYNATPDLSALRVGDFAKKLGHALKKRVNVVYDDTTRLTLKRVGMDQHTKVARWAVVKKKTPQTSWNARKPTHA